jgi:hypothetical protein
MAARCTPDARAAGRATGEGERDCDRAEDQGGRSEQEPPAPCTHSRLRDERVEPELEVLGVSGRRTIIASTSCKRQE